MSFTDTEHLPTRAGGFERPAHRPPGRRQLMADFGGRYVGQSPHRCSVLCHRTRGGDHGRGVGGFVDRVPDGIVDIRRLRTQRVPHDRRELGLLDAADYFWTIPGTVLVGQALESLTWPEVIGAYIATGILITVLGATGLVAKLMALIPDRIVMAMVAGRSSRSAPVSSAP